jgi:hypothetical protein
MFRKPHKMVKLLKKRFGNLKNAIERFRTLRNAL